MTAGEAVQAAAVAALKGVLECGVYDAPPLQAAFPYALIEAGSESDWSHKSGEGREVRLAISLHDRGENPAWLRSAIDAAEGAAAATDAADGWQIVTLRHLRTRLVKQGARRGPGGEWTAVIELRARMLRA